MRLGFNGPSNQTSNRFLLYFYYFLKLRRSLKGHTDLKNYYLIDIHDIPLILIDKISDITQGLKLTVSVEKKSVFDERPAIS